MKNKPNSILLVLGLLFFGGNTIAQLNTFPYSQDFETFSTCPPSNCNVICPLTDGWVNEGPGDGGEWTVDANGTSSSFTGPSVDYAPGNNTGNYLYFETSAPCYSNVTAILHAPVLDLSGIGGLNMIFANHMLGATMGTLSVELSTDGGVSYPTTLWTKSGDQGDQWFVDTISLTAYAGMSDIRIRFRGVSTTSFTSDMAIDAVRFYEPLPIDAGIMAISSPGAPFCNLINSPVSGTISNFGTNTLVSANINWAVNSVVQTPIAWTGSLPIGSNENIALSTYTFVNGDFLEIWTSNPNGATENGSGSTNDTSSVTIQSGLSGFYSIGATGDYTSFNGAVSALKLYGICGPVVFDVEDGNYLEQISIPEIVGTSLTNTITFRSLNANPALVSMAYSPVGQVDNYTIQLNGADHITFKELTIKSTGLTYSTVINVKNESSWNTFDGNTLIGDSNTLTNSTVKAVITSYNGSLDTMNMFLNNTIKFGSYGMYWYGNDSTGLETGLIIDNNLFLDIYYTGLRLDYQKGNTVTNNTIRFNGNYLGITYAAYSSYNNGEIVFENNDFNVPTFGYCWYLSNCTGSLGSPAYMANNFFSISNSLSINTSYGVYMINVSNMNLSNNSINIYSGASSTQSISITGGTGNNVRSNNIINWGSGYGLYLNGGLSTSDNNNIYVPNGNVGFFGSDQTTLIDWQTSTGLDLNSLTGDPLFVSEIDLHTCNDILLDGNGWVDMNITSDIDGQLRDTSAFDIGADEFLGLSNFGYDLDTIWKCMSASELLGGWAPTSDGTYLWSTTETTPSIDVSVSGSYSVTVTTACGTAVSSIEIVNIPDAVAEFNVAASFMTSTFTSTSSGTIDTYYWNFGDGGSSSIENPVHVYGADGTYIVTLTVTGPCGTDIHTDTVIASIVGIDETALNQSLELFPNPNSGEFTINLNLDQASTVSAVIFDAQGRLVWNKEFGIIDGNISELVNLGNDDSGVYFLRVTSNNETVVKKIIIE